jgi:hypothetical protein
VAYHYQNIKFRNPSFTEDRLEFDIVNYNATINANQYQATYEITEDGRTVAAGTIGAADSDVPAGQTKRISIPINGASRAKPGAEYFLNVRFTKANPVILAGYGEDYVEGYKAKYVEVSQEQFALPSLATAQPQPDPTSSVGPLSVSDGAISVTVSGDGFSVTISKTKGTITSYKYGGTEFFAEGPEPNFWRPRIDNYGAVNDMWRLAGQSANVGAVSVAPFMVDGVVKSVDVTVPFTLSTARNSSLTTVYSVIGDGEVKVDNYLKTASGSGELPKIGAQMVLADGYDKLEFLGRGLRENYIDRNLGSPVGRYTSTVADDFHNYVKVQEYGNRTGMRWLALTKDASSPGLLFSATREPFEASAVSYKAQDISGARHWFQVEGFKYPNTVLNIDMIQRGLGGASCGPDTLSQYRVYGNGAEYRYGYRFVGFSPAQDPGALARKPIPDVLPADKSYLLTSISKANALARENYERLGLDKLQTALDAAIAVSGVAEPPQSSVDNATAALNKAMDELVSILYKLSGEVYGNGPSWGNNPNTTFDKVFDGDTGTFFDRDNANDGYSGIDLGAGNESSVALIRYYPRSGYEDRLNGSTFRGSMTVATGGNAGTLLHTVSGVNQARWYEAIPSDTTAKFRYLWYKSGTNSWGNVAEAEFYARKLDRSLLDDRIAWASALVASDYTPGSWERLRVALAAATAVAPDATQSVIDDATSALKTALAGLERV